TRNGRRCDGRNIDLEWEKFGGKRKVLRSRHELEQYEASEHEKVLGLFAGEDMQYAKRRPADEPDLMLMTKKAIEILEKSGKEYFLMVEGSLIDIAQHANSMHGAFDEMREFESAIKEARRMTDPSETLILVTADHAHALTIPGYVPLRHSIFENYNLGKHSVPGMFFALGPGYRGGFENEKLTGNPREESYLQPSAIYTESGHHGDYIIQRDPKEIAFLLLVLTTALFVMALILIIVLIMCIRAMDINRRSNVQLDKEESKSGTEWISEESV
ncbi:hypothetical protein GCK32_015068, partial [Trichostrongylus colubriformis]